jgi:predicted PurR-regulated permease PerM
MKETSHISISTGTLVRIFTSIAVFIGLFYVSDFILALLVAVVLASAVEMPVRVFGKWGIPRSVSVIGIFILLLLVVGLVVFVFIPPIADDVALFIKTLPKILDSIRIFGSDMGFKDLSLSIADLSRDISRGEILSILRTAFFGSSGLFASTKLVLGTVVNLVLTFVLAFYLALEEHGVQKFLRIVVPQHQEEYVTDLWARAQRKIGLWMQGQLLLSLLVSLLVYIPMLILDMPYSTLLALLAFVGELIPMVGLTLATVPALFLAWMHGGTSLLGVVALIYFIIAQLENHVFYPKVMNKMIGVPSVVVIIAIVIGAKLAGIWGVLLAMPAASILMELADDVDKRRNHGL